MNDGFQRALDHIRAISHTEAEKGRLFERLVKRYFEQDPLYRDRFSNVWLWSDWPDARTVLSGRDLGIDLVAEERDGGYCAIQCKCYAPDTHIARKHIDSFLVASARPPFTTRIFVDTGGSWGSAANQTIDGVEPRCGVLRFNDLAERPIDWPDLVSGRPEDLAWRHETFRLRQHQEQAFNDVRKGFEAHQRGKLIMACGTGKTFTALRVAEEIAGAGGRVLYLVPSIALFQQSMREWAEQRGISHSYIGICSDTRAGRTDEDATLEELEIPVTTDPDAISGALSEARRDAMTVVFCTYQSLELVALAQKSGAPAFDLVLCDEAHRTTGVEQPDKRTSPFVLVHDGNRIRATKRLYMTATPRLYTEGAKAKARRHEVEVFSMDDEATYGPELYRLQFSRAVREDLLSDYKVIVLGMAEKHLDAARHAHLMAEGGEIDLSDAAKIVGCWRALQNPENKQPEDGPVQPLRRAIAFTNTIKSSKQLERHWGGIVEQAVARLPEMERDTPFHCVVRHVDGQHHALERKARIEWLKGSGDDCRILTNARCLSEGIDVPALDAVLFMAPRNSHVDVVQAVGRAMRKAPDKRYGYIILPIAVPDDVDPKTVLDSHDRFAVLWSVLRALRSHDDRLDAEINQLDLNQRPTSRIIFSGFGEDPEQRQMSALPGLLDDLPPEAIYAKIVEKCGDRKYWESWAGDVAKIFATLVERIDGLLRDPRNSALLEWFAAFHGELRNSINESIDRKSAIEMMAQHILTRPVFEALFENYDFVGGNPVARALDHLQRDFAEFGLEAETRDLKRFYESVQNRVRGLDNLAARQTVLKELYEKFFAIAMEKDADRLGVVYTPNEIVDFILESANDILRDAFNTSLSDDDVHVLDPFTGTGIFPVRLLQSALIRDADLSRKYREELHANEIVLLAYYIAAINAEEAFRGRVGLDSDYVPFGGIVLADTFNLHPDRGGFLKDWLPENSKRAERQQKSPIQVIVGNPPWSAGQRSSADNNPNTSYPEMEKRVADTYAARSTATLKNSLYDTYKMAIRWASDRIGEKGVVAFVTNGSWIEGRADSGVRACLAEEFSTIYVLNLRGNQRTQGERSRQEGGKVFGSGSRAPVAISLLVRNPNAEHQGCRILYRDIGDYLTREEKLAFLKDAKSVTGIDDWRTITPDGHHDWIGQRDDSFQELIAIGSKAVKAGKAGREGWQGRLAGSTIFELYSGGYKTGRDAYTYNFSRTACAANGRNMVNDYLGAFEEFTQGSSASDLENLIQYHSAHIRWDQDLRGNLRRRKETAFSSENIWHTQYRPFVKQYCYVDHILTQRKHQMDRIFPHASSFNKVICVPGVGGTTTFSALVVDAMPDLGCLAGGSQCFPFYRYDRRDDQRPSLPLDQESAGEGGLQRFDNISESAVQLFRERYQYPSLTKDDVFNYVYGVLHSTQYRSRYQNNLTKELPRIPFAPDFAAFAEAGRTLSELHLGYETCAEFPLDCMFSGIGEPRPEHFRIGRSKMKLTGEQNSSLQINPHITLCGIPAEAHAYAVNGRTPIEWFIDRYRITQDKHSGIVNDPNGWFEHPEDLVSAIKRIIYVSVETTRICAGLPELFENDEMPEPFVAN